MAIPVPISSRSGSGICVCVCVCITSAYYILQILMILRIVVIVRDDALLPVQTHDDIGARGRRVRVIRA
jgi:hypothetical protein